MAKHLTVGLNVLCVQILYVILGQFKSGHVMAEILIALLQNSFDLNMNSSILTNGQQKGHVRNQT